MYLDSEAELHLLVETKDEGDTGGSTLILNDKRWSLTRFSSVNDGPLVHPEYTCVSYVWGSEWTPNTFSQAPELISANTLPALSAAMHNSSSKAFWIDAFCVPTTQPARHTTLASMGFIYSQAKEVRAALSKSSFMAVQQLNASGSLDEEGLTILEQDNWVKSVWTYQEVVNSRQLVFVSPDAPGVLVSGSEFLNGVGYALQKHKESSGLDNFSIREKFPSLDAFEDLIADWMTAGYTERSALAVMSSMDRRVWTEEQNYFFAMIGAVSSRLYRRAAVQEAHLSEIFMAICEEKNDFSFIFSSTKRSEDPARRWRPSVGLLPSILPWHSWGESQPGKINQDGSLQLDGVVECQRSPLHEKTKELIAKWLHRGDLAKEDEAVIAESMHTALVRMGFTGRKEYMSVREGLFFPQTLLPPGVDIKLHVSTTIRWTFGAPGLASICNGVTPHVPGIFVGFVDTRQTCSVCLV